MVTLRKKIVAALIAIFGLAIFGLAILFFPITVILLQDLVGALINPRFAHCEVMDKARLGAALKRGFTVNAGCCAEHMIWRLSGSDQRNRLNWWRKSSNRKQF